MIGPAISVSSGRTTYTCAKPSCGRSRRACWNSAWPRSTTSRRTCRAAHRLPRDAHLQRYVQRDGDAGTAAGIGGLAQLFAATGGKVRRVRHRQPAVRQPAAHERVEDGERLARGGLVARIVRDQAPALVGGDDLRFREVLAREGGFPGAGRAHEHHQRIRRDLHLLHGARSGLAESSVISIGRMGSGEAQCRCGRGWRAHGKVVLSQTRRPTIRARSSPGRALPEGKVGAGWFAARG